MGDISKGVANTLDRQKIYKKYKNRFGLLHNIESVMTIELALIKSYCRIIYSIYRTNAEGLLEQKMSCRSVELMNIIIFN